VQFAPASTQTTTSTNHLIDLGLTGSVPLGVRGQNALLSLSAAGQYPDGGTYNAFQHFLRIDNSGAILAVGQFDNGATDPPIVFGDPNYFGQTRMIWYPARAAFRAGHVDGVEWDPSNIGSYSVAFGLGTRSFGAYSFAAGERTVATQHAVAMGRYNKATGFSSVALGEGASAESRNGSFLFADRSYNGSICDLSVGGIPPYGTNDAGCAATGQVDTILRVPWANSFTVRASGGTAFYTNVGSSTGLRMSSLSSAGSGGGNFFGSFVWTDRSSDNSITPTATNQTIFRSSGGFTVYTDAAATAGVTVGPGGGSWSSVSDRNLKENFADVDGDEILRRLRSVPITTWNYRAQNARIRHIGPMAQDFMAAFHVGEDDRHIATIDPDGVALAGVKALDARTLTQQQRIEALERENAALRERLDRIEKLLENTDHQQK
jgi:hypothetical protein